MRVAVDLTSLADNFSGIERYAANVTRALLEQDSHNEYILVFKESVFPLFESCDEACNVSTVVLPRVRGGKLVFLQWTLPRALRKLRADVCLFLAFPCPLLYFGQSVSAIHDLCCWDCPDTMTARSRLLWRSLNRKAVNGGKHVITVSEFSKRRIVEHYGIGEDRVHVAYDGVDGQLFAPCYDADTQRRVTQKYRLPDEFILSLSTLEPRKNLPLLIEAWSGLVEEGFEHDLVLAGRPGWGMGDFLKGVRDSIRPRIHVTGFVDDEDLPVLYGLSSLFVFPSRYEGFGLPPVEALCSGARVLCSDIECLREICGEASYYFESGSVQDLRSKLCNLVSTDERSTVSVRRYEWSAAAGNVSEVLSLVADGTIG